MTLEFEGFTLDFDDDLPVVRTVILDVDWGEDLEIYLYQTKSGEWIVTPVHRYVASRGRAVMKHTISLPENGRIFGIDFAIDGERAIHGVFVKESAVG